MSIHPSLRTAGGATSSSRNVLKRYERVRHLMTQGQWTDGQSVFGLPKLKQTKIKARKAAKEKEETAGAPAEKPAAGAAPGAT